MFWDSGLGFRGLGFRVQGLVMQDVVHQRFTVSKELMRPEP